MSLNWSLEYYHLMCCIYENVQHYKTPLLKQPPNYDNNFDIVYNLGE